MCRLKRKIFSQDCRKEIWFCSVIECISWGALVCCHDNLAALLPCGGVSGPLEPPTRTSCSQVKSSSANTDSSLDFWPKLTPSWCKNDTNVLMLLFESKCCYTRSSPNTFKQIHTTEYPLSSPNVSFHCLALICIHLRASICPSFCSSLRWSLLYLLPQSVRKTCL